MTSVKKVGFVTKFVFHIYSIAPKLYSFVHGEKFENESCFLSLFKIYNTKKKQDIDLSISV